MHLNKEQSGRRWCEIRRLWNEWDPIGVLPNLDGPRDEYENYLGASLRLLESGASHEQIAAYLSHIVCEYMGLGSSGVQHSNPTKFAQELQHWFAASWAGTHV